VPYFRQITHLLPRAEAWQLTTQKTLRDFFEGLTVAASDARDFVDLVWFDLFPETTRELDAWENEFGLLTASTEQARRDNIAAAFQETGGQSPSYFQGQLQAAGFNVWVHEWWELPAPPYVARDPRLYTTPPLLGSYQCSAFPSQPQCSAFESQPQCNRFLINNTNYIVNLNLTPTAPPPVPDDPDFWPYFIYIGGETFPDLATVPNARRLEFERLVQKLKPSQQWIVLLIDYTTGGVFDDSFDASFE
jgi:hypothetical protein